MGRLSGNGQRYLVRDFDRPLYSDEVAYRIKKPGWVPYAKWGPYLHFKGPFYDERSGLYFDTLHFVGGRWIRRQVPGPDGELTNPKHTKKGNQTHD